MTTRTASPRVVATGLAFAENPRWHDGRLFFSDMHGGRVCAMDEGGRVTTVVATPDTPSGIGFMPDGSLLVVAMHTLKVMRWQRGILAEHADLSHLAKVGINDMLVDSSGRAYVVQFGFDWRAGEAPVAAPLLVVQPDGRTGIAAPGLHTGNGMAQSPDGRTLIIAESGACRLSAFNVDATGRLSNRRLFAQLPERHYPDGICLDSEGGVWASCCFGPGVIRIEEGGRATHLVPMPEGRNAFACMFGGADRRTLYICTAETEAPDAARAQLTSRIEAVDVGFSGAGLP